MAGWWDGLTGPLQIFYVIGFGSAAMLGLQMLLLVVGVGDGFDLGGEDTGLSGAISIRGLTAFFFVFGWVGVILVNAGAPLYASVGGAGAAGTLAMVAAGIMWRKAASLESDGSLDYSTAVGSVGRVYLTVPGDPAQEGKIEVMVQGRLRTVSAIAEQGSDTAAPGERVEVVGLIDPTTMLIRPLSGRPDKTIVSA